MRLYLFHVSDGQLQRRDSSSSQASVSSGKFHLGEGRTGSYSELRDSNIKRNEGKLAALGLGPKKGERGASKQKVTTTASSGDEEESSGERSKDIHCILYLRFIFLNADDDVITVICCCGCGKNALLEGSAVCLKCDGNVRSRSCFSKYRYKDTGVNGVCKACASSAGKR